jgi:UPF0716 protein FxsA
VLPLLVIPLVDLILLVWIGRHTSGSFVLALILAGVLAGGFFLRRAAGHSMRVLQMDLAAGRAPVESMQRTISLVAAGVLLIVPGVLTDLLALLLLVPLTRRLVGLWIGSRVFRSVQVRGFSWNAGQAQETEGRDRVIDVQVVEPAPEALPHRDIPPDDPGGRR